MASGHRTNFQAMADGIKRYRDAGGKRAMVASVDIDLAASPANLADDESFDLACGPERAAERLRRVAELGYDDILLRTTDRSAANLAAIRALVPRHTGDPLPR